MAMARKATALDPKNARGWNTLGISCYRAGQWDAAIDALRKSIELHPKGDAYALVVLAMAHWQKGDKKAARRWYDQSSVSPAESAAKDEELPCLRAEAEALLGLAAQSKPTAKKKERPARQPKP
jgi:Flp pilus assembly protein TadD